MAVPRTAPGNSGFDNVGFDSFRCCQTPSIDEGSIKTEATAKPLLPPKAKTIKGDTTKPPAPRPLRAKPIKKAVLVANTVANVGSG